MAYLRPPAFQRKVFNSLAMRFGIGGSTAFTVAGRKSGKALSIPVIPVETGGGRYLVSTRGEAEWVRNLRAAAGKCELTRKGKTEKLQATEVPTGERGPILEAYRKVAGSVVKSYFAKLPDAADHPTFKIEPRA